MNNVSMNYGERRDADFRFAINSGETGTNRTSDNPNNELRLIDIDTDEGLQKA